MPEIHRVEAAVSAAKSQNPSAIDPFDFAQGRLSIAINPFDERPLPVCHFPCRLHHFEVRAHFLQASGKLFNLLLLARGIRLQFPS